MNIKKGTFTGHRLKAPPMKGAGMITVQAVELLEEGVLIAEKEISQEIILGIYSSAHRTDPIFILEHGTLKNGGIPVYSMMALRDIDSVLMLIDTAEYFEKIGWELPGSAQRLPKNKVQPIRARFEGEDDFAYYAADGKEIFRVSEAKSDEVFFGVN